MLNNISIQGELRDNPVVTRSGNSYYVRFAIIHERSVPNKNRVREKDIFWIEAWDKLAQHIGNYYHKGSWILIKGSVYQNKQPLEDGTFLPYIIKAEDVNFSSPPTPRRR